MLFPTNKYSGSCTIADSLLWSPCCSCRPAPTVEPAARTTTTTTTSGGGCEPEGEHRCEGDTWEACLDGNWTPDEVCVEPANLCHVDLGCVECLPGARVCADGDVHVCEGDELGTSLVEECGPGEECAGGTCWDACELARQRESYLGCDFLAVTTLNSGLGPGFASDFAVVVGVPSGDEDATVSVVRGANTVATQVVPAGLTAAIELPMVAALQVAGGGLFTNAETAIVVDGAYEVHSSVPVVAYQFNPLHFSTSGLAYSYTNDASLLLPEHVLTGSYQVLTWPTWPYTPWVAYRGFVAVTATEDWTTVDITSSTTTAEGNPPPMSPGGTTTVVLQRGDVLQLLSGASATDDLSGTRIEASAPVATFVGVDCTYMPSDQAACDHLEEMAFPTETWGARIPVSALEHPDGGTAPSRYRVMARSGGTEVAFDPPVAPTSTLADGEWIQFDSPEDFVVDVSAPITLTQTMFGQDALGAISGGDPALGTGIPTSQWRTSYDFLVPATYTTNWLNLVRGAGAEVSLDGSALTGFSAIGAGEFESKRIAVAAGAHHIEGADPFSITAYGYAQYTSYLYPAGLNLRR